MIRASKRSRHRHPVPPWKSKRSHWCTKSKSSTLVGPHHQGAMSANWFRTSWYSGSTKEVVAQIARLTVRPTLRQRIIDSRRGDPSLSKIPDQLEVGPVDRFSKSTDDGLLCQGHLCVPPMSEIKNEILTEAHNSTFSIHPSGTKMYQDLKQHFWWRSMKKDIAEYVSKCLVCQQVKAPRQKTAGLLQPLSIPE